MGCAQLHGALVTVVSHKVAALWTLARAQLGLGRLDSADAVLREAARNQVLICEADTPIALLGWMGLDGQWGSWTPEGSDAGASAPADNSTCATFHLYNTCAAACQAEAACGVCGWRCRPSSLQAVQ